MKYIFLIFGLLRITHLSGQDYSIVYKFNPYVVDINKAMGGESNVPLDTTNYVMFCSLHIHGDKSLFTKDSILLIDSITDNKTMWVYSNQYYKDFENDLFVQTSGSFKQNHCYSDKLSSLYREQAKFWTYSDEKKNIINFQCKRAIAGDQIAWYSDQINVKDGPSYGTYGLPGLILELESESGIYTAIKIIQSTSKIDFLIPQNQTKDQMSIYAPISSNSSSGADGTFIKLNKNTPTNTWLKFKY